MKQYKFPIGVGSNIHLVIYVPSTKNKSIPLSNVEMRRRVRGVVNYMNKAFGGTTRIVGTGSFMFRGKPIEERVVLVETFTNKKDYRKEQLKIRKYLQEKKKSWGQVSLAYQFEESMFFI